MYEEGGGITVSSCPFCTPATGTEDVVQTGTTTIRVPLCDVCARVSEKS